MNLIGRTITTAWVVIINWSHNKRTSSWEDSVTYLYLFRAFLEFYCNSLNPIFSNKHTLRTTKSSKGSVTGVISEANPSKNPHIWYLIDIIWVKHSTFEDSKRKVHWISSIIVNFKIQCKHFPLICEPNLSQVMSFHHFFLPSHKLSKKGWWVHKIPIKSTGKFYKTTLPPAMPWY